MALSNFCCCFQKKTSSFLDSYALAQLSLSTTGGTLLRSDNSIPAQMSQILFYINISNSSAQGVQIQVNEDLDEDFLKATNYFESVLHRGDKKVYIVEAKNDMRQKWFKFYLNCNFLRNLNEKIELKKCFIKLLSRGESSTYSFVDITGKIYAMLFSE
ncbi:hypothetical protein BDEG_24593 [Batrachochytrium dendrobatidis JEL423]|uniref:Uncharacterized protein n=1 Tax=Batrachochytrium dendrobatidis (strain JEL423) TaxID=403673 RepID=A0A177WNA6_BATDL|nr:hypothetical protein BDEG_24593 [Batrachochytrium dendrobatidis JEL423]